MIVKVQRPISPPDAMLLIYDRSREWVAHCPQTREIVSQMGGSLKAYFEAEISGDAVRLFRRVEDQGW